MGGSYRKQVVFDIDGVLADFVRGFTLQACALFNLPPSVVRTTAGQLKWEVGRNDGDFGLSKQQLKKLWHEVRHDRSFWERLDSLWSSDERLELRALAWEYDFVYLTRRRAPDALRVTVEWLQRYDYPFGHVAVLVEQHKADYLNAYCDHALVHLVIDDKPEELERLLSAGWPAAAMSWSYNAHVEGVMRVRSLVEVTQLCGSLRW